MSFDFFEKLEEKVKQAVDTITLLQMELDDLRGKNQTLTDSAQTLISENQQLKEQQTLWQDRLQLLLERMENV